MKFKTLFKIGTRYIFKTKTRSLWLALCITASVALGVAVLLLASSLQASLIQTAISENGSWHFCFSHCEPSDFYAIREVVDIDRYAFLDQNSQRFPVTEDNLTEPAFSLNKVSDDYYSLLGVKIIEGRAPKNDDEILIPANLKKDSPEKYQVGKAVSFDKEYTIVGVSEPSRLVSSNFSKGYPIFTHKESLTDGCAIYFTLKNFNRDYGKISPFFFGDNGRPNGDYIGLLVVGEGESVANSIFSVTGMLAVLLSFVGGLIIYNTFLLSTDERVSAYVLLQKIGAQTKDILGIVAIEALLFSVICIPLGFAIGFALIGGFLEKIGNIVASVSVVSIDFTLAPNAGTLVACAIFSLAVILFSALIPVIRFLRAGKKPGKKEKRRSPSRPHSANRRLPVEGKLAWKNLKKFRKKYIATVSSAILGVVVFVGVSAFNVYSKETATQYAGDSYYSVYAWQSYENERNFTSGVGIYEKIRSEVSVEDGTYLAAFAVDCSVRCDLIPDELQKEDGYSATFYCIPDEKFFSFVGQDAGYRFLAFGQVWNVRDGLEYDLFPEGVAVLTFTGNEKCDSLTARCLPMENVPQNFGSSFSGQVCVVFPASVRNEVVDDDDIFSFNVLLRGENHRRIFKEVEELNQANVWHLGLSDNKADALAEDRMAVLLDVAAILLFILTGMVFAVNIFGANHSNITLRTKEFSLLRVAGMTNGQLWKMLLWENGICAAISVLGGTVLSVVCSAVLLAGFPDVPHFIFPTLPWGISVLGILGVFALAVWLSVRKLLKLPLAKGVRHYE